MLELDSFLKQQLSTNSADQISLSEKSAQANMIQILRGRQRLDKSILALHRLHKTPSLITKPSMREKTRKDQNKLFRKLLVLGLTTTILFKIIVKDRRDRNIGNDSRLNSQNRSSIGQSIYSMPIATTCSPEKIRFPTQRPAFQFLYPAVSRDFYKDDKSLWVNIDPMKKLRTAPVKQAKRTPEKQKRLDNQFKIYEERAIESYLDEAKKLMKKQCYTQAIDSLIKAKEKGQDHSDLYYLLGESKRQILKYESSEKDLLKAMKFKVHSPFVYESLGLLYKSQGKYQNAIVLIRSFIDQLQTPDAHNQLGMCYLKIKQYVSACVHFTRAIQMNPQNAWYFYNRGVAYQGQDLYHQALSDYGMSKKLDEGQFKELIAAKVVSLLTKQL